MKKVWQPETLMSLEIQGHVKIVDFLLLANFFASPVFFASVSIMYKKKNVIFEKNEKSLTACNFDVSWDTRTFSFWKPPIKICLEPDCQVGSSVLKVRQTLLKDWGPTIWVWSQMSTAVGIYVNVYQIWKTSRVFKFSSLVTVKPLTKS